MKRERRSEEEKNNREEGQNSLTFADEIAWNQKIKSQCLVTESCSTSDEG